MKEKGTGRPHLDFGSSPELSSQAAVNQAIATGMFLLRRYVTLPRHLWGGQGEGDWQGRIPASLGPMRLSSR